VGLGAVGHAVRRRAEAERSLLITALGCALLGAGSGGLSLLLLPSRLPTPVTARGASLVLAPLALGSVMRYWGRRRRASGKEATGIATFYGGASFGFGAALARFLGVSGIT